MLRGALTAVVAAAFACTSAADSEEDCHWIGSINPLTGGLGPVGLPLENAAKLAVNDINAEGGVAGKTLCIATGDDRTNSDRAKRIVEDMIPRYDIRAINGAAASAATLKAAEAANDAGMAIVSCCSTSPELTTHPEIYRTVPSDALQGVALANLAQLPMVAASTVAVIYLDNTYGIALKDEFVRAFDGTIAKTVPYQERQSSYAGVINEAFGGPLQSDTAVLIAYPVEGAQIVRDWQTSGIARNIHWLATDGLKDNNFVLAVGSAVPQFRGTAPIPNGQYYQGFVERYQQAYGGELPGIFTSNQYDAVMLIALAMAKVGESADPTAIRAAIPEISRGRDDPKVHADDLENAIAQAESGEVDYVGVSGDVDLDANGDVVSQYRVWSISPSDSQIREDSTCFDCSAAGDSVTCRQIDCM